MELEDAVFAAQSGDQVGKEIANAVDLFIDDFSKHKNIGGRELDADYVEMGRQWAALLRTGCPWRWEETVRPLGLIGGLLSVFRPQPHPFQKNRHWPMSSADDWNAILADEHAGALPTNRTPTARAPVLRTPPPTT